MTAEAKNIKEFIQLLRAQDGKHYGVAKDRSIWRLDKLKKKGYDGYRVVDISGRN